MPERGMRLINTKTLKLESLQKLQERLGGSPPYAILSHTWGSNEVSLQDYESRLSQSRQSHHRSRLRRSRRQRHGLSSQDGHHPHGPGWSKILAACRQARSQDLEYVWVDTCCIDQTSSAELGEAINSMFKWYQSAKVCYAFLEDVTHGVGGPVQGQKVASGTTGRTTTSVGFSHSRWFTRGWTLQELIAPKRVQFFGSDWGFIGEKKDLARDIQHITGIDTSILEGGPLQQVSVATRMSWAANRKTRRVEDKAYSLLGLFDVNMPLVYGEGSKAFLRLQEQILKQSDDHTIFAWRALPSEDAENQVRGLFASSPDEFQNFRDSSQQFLGPDGRPGVTHDRLVRIWDSQAIQEPITMTNKGIEITGRVQDLRPLDRYDTVILGLNCSFGGDPMRAAGIYLSRQRSDRYARVRPDELASIDPEGRNITQLKLYGLRHEGEIRGHHYDQPWTTSYKIRRELADKQLHHFQSASALGSRYEHAFYLQRRSLKPWSIFGRHTLYGVVIADCHGLLRFFRFFSEASHVDIVMKTYNGSRVALMYQPDYGTGAILVALGRGDFDVSYLDDAHATGIHHWINAVYLSKEELEPNSSSLLDFMASSTQTQANSTDTKVCLSDGSFKLYGEIVPVEVEGIPMQEVRLQGPWPVSLLTLLAHSGPGLLRRLIRWTVLGGLTVVMIRNFDVEALRARLNDPNLFGQL